MVLASVLLGSGCGPEVAGDDPPLGDLEVEGYLGGWYRQERRIEYRPYETERGVIGERRCGRLTEEAFEKHQATIDALDPAVDYDFGLDGEQCGWQDGLFGYVHLEGFEHSPFTCTNVCCRDELASIPWIYIFAGHQIDGDPLTLEGQEVRPVEAALPCE